MKKSKVPFIIYIVLVAAIVVALTALQIIKAANGYQIKDAAAPFLKEPILACKLSAVGLSLIFGIFQLVLFREKAFKQWPSFIVLFFLFGGLADLMMGLGQRALFYIFFVVAYTTPFLYRKPKIVEGVVRVAVLAVGIILVFVLESYLDETKRLTGLVAATLITTVVFMIIYYVKAKTRLNLLILWAFIMGLISDLFLVLSYLTANTPVAANIFTLFVWPTYIVEYILLQAGLRESLKESN